MFTLPINTAIGFMVSYMFYWKWWIFTNSLIRFKMWCWRWGPLDAVRHFTYRGVTHLRCFCCYDFITSKQSQWQSWCIWIHHFFPRGFLELSGSWLLLNLQKDLAGEMVGWRPSVLKAKEAHSPPPRSEFASCPQQRKSSLSEIGDVWPPGLPRARVE